MLRLSDFDEPEDLVAKYFSRRQNREVSIGVGDVVAIYEDDNVDVDDATGVERVVKRLVSVCKSGKLGSIEFCIKAREELVRVDGDIVARLTEMRRLTTTGRTRRISRGSRERNMVVGAVRNGIDEIDEQIEKRRFLEWGRV